MNSFRVNKQWRWHVQRVNGINWHKECLSSYPCAPCWEAPPDTFLPCGLCSAPKLFNIFASGLLPALRILGSSRCISKCWGAGRATHINYMSCIMDCTGLPPWLYTCIDQFLINHNLSLSLLGGRGSSSCLHFSLVSDFEDPIRASKYPSKLSLGQECIRTGG